MQLLKTSQNVAMSLTLHQIQLSPGHSINPKQTVLGLRIRRLSSLNLRYSSRSRQRTMARSNPKVLVFWQPVQTRLPSIAFIPNLPCIQYDAKTVTQWWLQRLHQKWHSREDSSVKLIAAQLGTFDMEIICANSRVWDTSGWRWPIILWSDCGACILQIRYSHCLTGSCHRSRSEIR